MLCPTPPDRLCDAEGRPYFLWDNELTLDELREKLRDPDPDVRAYWIGKVMRQAKPDDALTLVPISEMRAAWERVLRGRLGKQEAMWEWLLAHWENPGG